MLDGFKMLLMHIFSPIQTDIVLFSVTPRHPCVSSLKHTHCFKCVRVSLTQFNRTWVFSWSRMRAAAVSGRLQVTIERDHQRGTRKNMTDPIV